MDITYSNLDQPRTLAFFPNTRGVGYSFFERGQQHYISEMISARKRDNRRYMKRVAKIMDLCEPEVIVLEEYRVSKGGIKKGRTRELIKEIEKMARSKGIEVHQYTRHQIRDVFAFYNRTTKYEIAKLICLWIPWMDRWIYEPRKEWRAEPYSSAIFDAVSLIITYYYYN